MLAAALLLTTGAFAQSPAPHSLDLTECRISAGPGYPGIEARCGTLGRPLNPADPEAGMIDLNVAVVPALSLEPAPDPLVPIAGGPGQSTVLFYAGWFTAFERVRQERALEAARVEQENSGSN